MPPQARTSLARKTSRSRTYISWFTIQPSSSPPFFCTSWFLSVDQSAPLPKVIPRALPATWTSATASEGIRMMGSRMMSPRQAIRAPRPTTRATRTTITTQTVPSPPRLQAVRARGAYLPLSALPPWLVFWLSSAPSCSRSRGPA